MRSCTMSVSSIQLCLALLAVNCFGELTMIRELPSYSGDSYKFTCISEDDRSALVWNDDFRALHRLPTFAPIRPKTDPYCAIANRAGCDAKWEENSNWTVVHSIDHPMAPVFDSRWEDFKERSFPIPGYSPNSKQYVKPVPRSGTVVFSARGLGDINLLLCGESLSSCFRITIAASSNEKSQIRPDVEETPSVQYGASDEWIITASEWRTFTLEWTADDLREIKLYGSTGFNVTNRFEKWIDVKHLYVQSNYESRIRFHFYDYLRTVTNDTRLDSATIKNFGKNFCIELMVGLCAECRIEVFVVYSNKAVKHIETISGSWPTEGKLHTWKLSKANSEIPRGDIKLRIVSILDQKAGEGWWAIDSFRRCKVDGVRTSEIALHRSQIWPPSSFPMIGCQRLSYDSHDTVNSGVPTTGRISNNPPKCKHGQLGPSCAFQCTEGCSGASICQSSGCFCSPWFTGSDCTELEALVVAEILATEVSLQYLGLNGRDISSVSFLLESQQNGPTGTSRYYLNAIRDEIFEGVFTGLSPNTSYTARATVTTNKQLTVEAPETNFTTRCLEPSEHINLKVTPKESGIVMLTWNALDKTTIEFKVRVELLSTRLRDRPSFARIIDYVHPAQPKTLKYRIEVYLPTATTYHFYFTEQKARGWGNEAVKEYKIKASLGFMEKSLIVNQTETSIELKLPSIENETTSTIVSVIAKGSPPCGSSPVPMDLRKILNMEDSDEGWLVKTFQANENRTMYLPIGYYDAGPCSLDLSKTYSIVAVAFETVDNVSATITSSLIHPIGPSSTTTENIESSPDPLYLNWLFIALILLTSLCTIYIFRREIFSAIRRTRRTDLASYSQTLTNWVKSATTVPPHQPVPDDVEMFRVASPQQAAGWNRTSHSTDVSDFEDYVKESISNGFLKYQFKTLPKKRNKSCKHGSVTENKPKNRYSDIVPYDDTRVVLKKISNDRHSDYINANYVNGFRRKKAYIAAQGPKPQTVVDFWRMIWQTESLVICMLANLLEGPKDRERVKCEQYWPEFGDSKTYGDIVVVNEKNHVFSDYILRTFRVTCEEKTRIVEHVHYTSWPDHDVPRYTASVISYLKKIQNLPTGNGPIIVHCSAGVGRTGTIILCDICCHRAAATGTIDVLAELKKLRSCRLNMVDNELQYLFAHVVLVEMFVSRPTELPCDNSLPKMIEELKKELPHHIERLHKIAWQDEALHPVVSSRRPLPEQLAKNRFPELAPGSSSLVSLERYPIRNVNSNYISAVTINSLNKARKQYLASQLPLPSTLSDFWRLVAEQRVELVIILQRPDPDDPTCCSIVQNEESFDPVSFLTVELIKSSGPEKSPGIDELVLTDMSWAVTRTQQVTVLTCLEWELGKNGKPPPPTKLVDLWRESEKLRHEKGPTLVLCHDGVTGCGLYLALSFLLERMTVERVCDTIFAARAIRQARPEFVQSQEQFEYLYDAAAKYMESFETFAKLT